MADTKATADRSAMGFAGLASLVSTVPAWTPPRPPRAPPQGRAAWGLIGLGMASLVGILQHLAPPAHHGPAVTTVKVGPQYFPSQTFTPQNPGQFALPPATFPQRPPAPQPPISEVKPPPGTNLTLSASQILYCLAQKARLDEMEGVVDLKSTQVGRFNALVDDFNLRCVSYNYRSADMETARRRVEAIRPTLRAQAVNEVAAWR